MKKTGFFQTLLLAAATLAAQTFDADSAKAFFDASPDLAKKSRQYFAEAEAEYAPNAAPSYEKLVVAKYLSALAKYGKSASPELRAELLGNFALLDEFVSILSPDDDAARVFEISKKSAPPPPINSQNTPSLQSPPQLSSTLPRPQAGRTRRSPKSSCRASRATRSNAFRKSSKCASAENSSFPRKSFRRRS